MKKILIPALIFLMIAVVFYFAGALIIDPENSTVGQYPKQIVNPLSEENDQINLSMGLTNKKLPNLKPIVPAYTYKLIIGDSVLSLTSFEWIDAGGRVILNLNDFISNNSLPDKKLNLLRITDIRGTGCKELVDWHQAYLNKDIRRKSLSIIAYDTYGNEKIRWDFFNAWPSKWDGPDFNAKGNEVAIETLTLEMERLEREDTDDDDND